MKVGTKILLLEDDTAARDALTELLLAEGFEVLATDEGRKALELAETWRPAAILLDLHLEGMGGKQFRAEQKRRPRLAGIPVIVVTAHPDPTVESDAVVTKPFAMADLLATMERVVPGFRKRARAPAR